MSTVVNESGESALAKRRILVIGDNSAKPDAFMNGLHYGITGAKYLSDKQDRPTLSAYLENGRIPIFEVFEEQSRPDIVITNYRTVDRALARNIEKYKTPTLLRLDDEGFRRNQYVNPNWENVAFFSAVFPENMESVYGSDFDMENTHYIEYAAGQGFWNGKPDPKYYCDYTYVGDYSAEKLYLLEKIIGGRIKIFGDTPWPTIKYVGKLSRAEENNLYASTQTAIVMTNFKYTPEAAFNIAAANENAAICFLQLLDDDKVSMTQTGTESYHGRYVDRFDQLLEIIDNG